MRSNNAIRHGVLLVCIGVALPGVAAERMVQTDQLFDPKGPLVASLYQTKAGSPGALRREQVMLEMIGFREDAQALGGFIERATLQQILGERPAPAATVGDAIQMERKQSIALGDLRARVLKTALRTRIGPDTAEAPKELNSDLSRFRHEGASAWRSIRTQYYAEYFAIPLAVTNSATEAIKDFDGSLVLAGGGEPIHLSCSRGSRASGWIQPGQTVAGMCHTEIGKAIAPSDFVRAVARASGQDLEIAMGQIVFPALTVRPARAYWSDEMSDRAWALRRLRESSCSERGVCFEDAKEAALSAWGLAIASGLVAGMLAYWIAARLTRRRATVLTGIVLSIAAALALLGALGFYFRSLPSDRGMGALADVIIIFLAIYAWAGFLAGLWGMALLTRIRRKPQTAQPLST